MNKKRNVNYVKPEDPEFLKILKKQAGYDDSNHKFDSIETLQKDFVEDGDDEQPQVIVLGKGDLTAEQADEEKKRIEKKESETKADLNQRVIFQAKIKSKDDVDSKKRKHLESSNKPSKPKKRNVLSFIDDNDVDQEDAM